MVVDHAGRLHVRVDDRGADEAEAALLEILAERVGLRRSRRHLLVLGPAILNRLAADEGPQVLREAAVLGLKIQVRARVGDRRLDLQPVADDARILQQPRQLALAEARDALGIKAGERLALALALVEDRRP